MSHQALRAKTGEVKLPGGRFGGGAFGLDVAFQHVRANEGLAAAPPGRGGGVQNRNRELETIWDNVNPMG